LICANSRTPRERRGDLDAQLAAHRYGNSRLVDMASPDPGTFADLGDGLLRYSERLARMRLATVGCGSYGFADEMDGDGLGSERLPIEVTLTIGDGRFEADFTGTAPQTEGAINAPLAVTCSAVYYAVACLLGDVPINSGTFAPVTIRAPEGCLLNPVPPAAVSAGNVETSQRVVDVLLGALANAAPDAIPAASQGTMNNTMIGGRDPRTGERFSYYETLGGGAGGGPSRRGASGVQVHMTNTRNTPVEALEAAYPLRILEYSLRRGSGGGGEHPGGDGLVRRIKFLAAARATVVSERRTIQPWGLAGGAPGACGDNRLDTGNSTEQLAAKQSVDVAAGSVLTIETPGGGGWGSGQVLG
jgi:N-methylhydantoinase B